MIQLRLSGELSAQWQPIKSNGQWVKIAARGFRAADIPSTPDCDLLIVVTVQLDTTRAINVWASYMFKPHALFGFLNASNGKVRMSAGKSAKVNLTDLELFHFISEERVGVVIG